MAKIRTRARAVDMLGRQQIATIQNAIAELFKNAYDAYAHKIQVDYLKNNGPDGNGTLLIRDNGFGMTQEDFENKWLVLGTESKVKTDSPDSSYVPPGETPRKITGEKGIGRLAIALLGRQVVVFTRAHRYDESRQGFELHDLVVAWIHWGLFEIPGINLEDIEFPVKTYPGGTLPDREELEHLRAEFIQDIQSSKACQRAQDSCTRIIEEIKNFNPVLKEFDQYFRAYDQDNEEEKESEKDEDNEDVRKLSLLGKGHGTSFLIGGVNRSLPNELATEDKNQDYSFRQLLLGFVDKIFNPIPINFHVSFKVWEKGSFSGLEYLNPETFFTQDELDNCTDHFFMGTVDEFGQCKGSLRIYDQKYNDVVIPFGNKTNRATECGSFRILFGALQGNKSESIVAKQNELAFSDMNAKLANLGGIYMYRDGIRILPYGLTDFDWLDIEKRRTLGAAYYYFSYRRMIGAVLLTNPTNKALEEKAGREGFQKNVPYQQLRSILMNLLVHLATDFFRAKGKNTDIFEQRKAELVKEAKAFKKKQEQSRAKRDKFTTDLNAFWKKLNDNYADKAIDELLQKLDAKMQMAVSLPNRDDAAIRLISVEQEAFQDLETIRKSLTVKPPMGVGLPKHLKEDLQTYENKFQELNDKQIVPCQHKISQRIGEMARQATLKIDQRKRLEQQLDSLVRQRKNLLKESSDAANKYAKAVQTAVDNIADKAKRALDDIILSIQTGMNNTSIQNLSDTGIEKLRLEWESKLKDFETKHQRGVDAAKEMLSSLTDMLVSLSKAMKEESEGDSAWESIALAASAMEARVLDLEEQADQDFEMVQLGVAIAIINHEFRSAITEIRKGLRDLDVIAKQAPVIRNVYDQIQRNFEHLDGYLNLFTPLQRRINRKKRIITGPELSEYIYGVFSARFLRHDIIMKSTPSFREFQFECFPSTIYPVVINLVDNAIFWLSSSQTNRKILLDAVNDHIIIANNGPEIDSRDTERIFERGFTKKLGGRGLGLYISRKALAQEGMRLEVVNPPDGYNTAFGIFKTDSSEGASNDN